MIPGSLVGIIAATAMSTAFDLDALAVVGDIPKTLLLSDRLDLSELDLAAMSNLVSPAVSIAALGMKRKRTAISSIISPPDSTVTDWRSGLRPI